MSFYTTAPSELIDLIMEFAAWDTVKTRLDARLQSELDVLETEVLVMRCEGWICWKLWLRVKPEFQQLTAKWSPGAKGLMEDMLMEDINYALDCPWHLLV